MTGRKNVACDEMQVRDANAKSIINANVNLAIFFCVFIIRCHVSTFTSNAGLGLRSLWAP